MALFRGWTVIYGEIMKRNSSSRSSSEQGTERTLAENLAVVSRGKWIILSVFAVVLAASVIYTMLADPVYTATCQVLLNKGEMKSTFFGDAVRPDRLENTVQNELVILNSRSLADTVAERLILRRYLDQDGKMAMPVIRPQMDGSGSTSPPPLTVVSARLSAAVDFDPLRDSDVIQILAKSKNALEAALIANTFAEAYRDRNIYMSRTKSRSFREFLQDQAGERKKVLEETETSLQGYMEKQNIVSLDDESKKVIDQLSSLEATRDAADISLRQLQNTLAQYQEQLPQQETNVARLMGEANDPYIRRLQEEIAKLEVEKDVTVAQNPSSVGREVLNEKVKEIDGRINALRSKLQSRTDEFLQSLTPSQGGGSQDAAGYLKSVKSKIIETQIEVQALEAKRRALDDVIRQYEVQFGRIPSKSVALARLQRARLSNEKLYLMVEEKFNEANIQEKSNIGYVEIVEPAAPPASPSSPKVLVNIALGVVLGLGLGLLGAFVREYIDVRVQSPEDLKRRGFNPLATIKNIDRELARLNARRTIGGPDHAGLDKHLITLSFPFSSVAESYRQIRTNLQFARQGEPVRTIVVTSALPGEGKSTTIANLALSFAQTGKKVLLVDADLRRPTLDGLFKLKREPGLSDYLAGKTQFDSVVRMTRIENLDLVACGAIHGNPSELLGTKRMKEFIDHAKSLYEIILLDSSPILAVTDPAVTSTSVDGVIIVASAGKTRMKEMEESRDMMEAVGGQLLGIVLNNFDVSKAYGLSYRSGGTYGYAYTYGSERLPKVNPALSNPRKV
jgi:capsular exopolysaccharide synthesis family protein